MAKLWSLTATQLKPLDAAALLVFALRNARRTARWLHDEDASRCDEIAAFVLASSRSAPSDAAAARKLVRLVSDASAARVNAARGDDEARARASNYAASALSAAVDAALAAERPARVKAVIDAAKYCASLGISLAHAGLVRESATQGELVNFVGDCCWRQIHGDIAKVSAHKGPVTTVADVDAIAALWDEPWSWTAPPREAAR